MKRRDLLKAFGLSAAAIGASAAVLRGISSDAAAATTVDKVRYVRADGKDTNDGRSPASAKRSVAAAVRSLPEEGSGPTARKSGDVYIGPGLYVEDDTPIDCSANIRFHGSGAPLNSGAMGGEYGGTVVRLADNRRTHLFAPRDSFDDWAHAVIFEGMVIDGNRANNEGDFDLIRLRRPGFNTTIRDVMLVSAPRTGIHIEEAASNFYLFNVTGTNCGKHFFRYTGGPATNNVAIAMFGIQIDDSGEFPIQIDHNSFGSGHFAVYSLETEATRPDQHRAVIRYRPIRGGNGLYLTLDNIAAWKAGAVKGTDEAVVLIEDGDGAGPQTTYRNLINDGYDWVYRDLKTGINSKHREQAKFSGSLQTSMQLGPVIWSSTDVGPEGQVVAPPGSLCSKTDGTLWIKSSGKRSRGWKKVRTGRFS